jgi:hypothetical protein
MRQLSMLSPTENGIKGKEKPRKDQKRSQKVVQNPTTNSFF